VVCDVADTVVSDIINPAGGWPKLDEATYRDRKDFVAFFPAHFLACISKLWVACGDEGVSGRCFGLEGNLGDRRH
jgi:hypothetical protein